jgi:hypothetical protein
MAANDVAPVVSSAFGGEAAAAATWWARLVVDPKRTPQQLRLRGDLDGAWISTGPGMSLKWRFERRLRDAAGIVRDRGRGDRGDHF